MRRTKEDAALTRAQLLEAALKCFQEKGYVSTTLDDIARAGARGNELDRDRQKVLARIPGGVEEAIQQPGDLDVVALTPDAVQPINLALGGRRIVGVQLDVKLFVGFDEPRFVTWATLSNCRRMAASIRGWRCPWMLHHRLLTPSR